MFTLSYECPTCKKTIGVGTGAIPEKKCCSECGTELINVTKPEEMINFGEKKENEVKETTKTEEKFLADLPKGLTLREQNPNCNKQGHLCATMDGQLCCLTPEEHVEDSDGNIPLFDVKACSKNPKGNLEFNEVTENE